MTSLTPEDQTRLTKETFVSRVEYHPVLGSTNDRSLELAGEPHLETPLLIIAGEQTAGRGRGSNRWWSADGALTFSLLLEPGLLDLPQSAWPRAAVVTGLSLCELFQELIPEAEVGLKWPNDVWLYGKKAAGILVEAPPAGYPIPPRLIVGIGINVNNSWKSAPQEIQDKGISLSDVAGNSFSFGEILIRLMLRLQENLRQLAEAPDLLPPRWKSHCALTGKTVEIQQGDHLIQGECHGIDDDGGLLVKTPLELRKIYGGVVASIC